MNALLDSPCPSGNKPWLGRRQQYQSNDPWNDGTLDDFENTAAIDFTTEIRIPSLAREKPRRAHSKTSFAIHDDSKQNTTFTSSSVTRNNTLKRKTQDGRSSLLAQPAQRFQRPRVSTAGRSPTENPNAGRKGTSGQQSGNFERRQSYQKAVESTSASTTSENDVLKKDVRRETVYIPTEDTTMPAVFMKLFSPLKSNQINANGSNPVDNTASISSLEARIAAKRKARTSTSTAPKRAPLQEATKVPQQSAIHKNIFGKNGGKENIPPGYIVGDGTKFNTKGEGFPVFEMPTKKSLKTVHKTETRSSNQVEKAKKPVLKATKANSSIVSMKTADQQKTKKITPKIHGKASIIGLKNSGAENSRSSGSIVRNKLSISQIRPMTIDQRYPLLDNDITNPMMYEENWLLHQEIVITQLVNGLFDSANGKLDAGNSDVLRHELLQIYQSDAFLLLYKRLHASILYGALAPPKEALRRGSRLSDDIGMKRTFLNFWTETYDLHALRAASEVIIGRRISPSAQINGRLSESLTKKHKGLKRTLETFLETFLIRNEDKEQPAASQDEVPGWLYRHTVLRSILIIILLDSGRLTPRTSLPKRLFATSSPHKSSTAALQALANQLLPSTGDIMRPLNHLDCQLCYKQHDLQDYEFHINNLAVDLRDGVILTRLAELFLYPSALQLSSGLELDTTTSMTETLASGGMKAEDEWPLSQNLKLPCTSRATKIFNTQIALMALGESKEMKNATKDICAEDIVDGHREKTISLLWGLVGKWGLTQLIDWDDVRNEITRLQKKIYLHPDSAGQEGERLPNVGSVSHKEMLVRWASILGQLKGLQVDNLSTSFADGRIFESIIDEYEGYLTGEQKVNHHLSPKSIADKKSSLQDRGLEARLRSLGCSSQFASLVAPPSTGSRILDSDFVLGALTFLCSRLLTSTKRIRATIVIQTAWRQVLACRALHRRALAKRTAEQCAVVVNARDRILWAKSVIVMWWRKQNQTKRKATLKSTKFPNHKSKGVHEMSAVRENGGSSTCVVELQPTAAFSTKEDGQRPPGITLNTERENNDNSNDHTPGWDQDTESLGPERAVAHAREKWNEPSVNAPRTFATFWCFVIMGANDAAYGALIPYLETYYNLSYTIVSLVFLSPLVGYAVAALFNHAIHMRLGQRGVAILSSSFHLIAYVINSVHPPFPVLVVSFIFAGLGNGLGDSAWNAWVGNLANANEVLGFLHGFYGLGAVLSPLVATSLITKANWQWYTFYYLMIGGAVIELAFGTVAFWKANQHEFRRHIAQSSEQSSEHKGGNGLKEALLTKPAARVTWLCAAFLLGYVGAEVALGGWIVTFMMRVRHGGAFASGMTATGFWIGITVGRVVLGFVTARIGEKFAISIYLLLAMVFELIFWLVPQFYVSAVAIAIQGFFLGPLFPAAIVAATKLLPKHLHVSSIGFAAALGGAGAAVSLSQWELLPRRKVSSGASRKPASPKQGLIVLEARLEQASLLKKVVDAIKDLVQDCNFDCNDSGIALQAMDNSHVALVSMLMRAEGFSPYRCDRNIALGINLVSLTKVLRAAQNEDILTLKAEDSPDVVNLMFESAETDRLSEYDIKLMDIDQEHLAIPETEYAATVSMPAAEFQRICRDLNALSESVVIEATKEGIKFSCQGDIGNGSVTVRQNTNVDKPEQNVSIQLSEPVALTFSLKYLVNFCKATALSTQVNLCLSQEVPLRVEYSLGSGHLRFFLAPKIGEED